MRRELWRVRLEPGRPIGTTSAPPPRNPASNFPTIQAHRDSDKPSMREMGMALGTGEHRIEPPSRRAVFFSTLAAVLLIAGAITLGVFMTAGQKPLPRSRRGFDPATTALRVLAHRPDRRRRQRTGGDDDQCGREAGGDGAADHDDRGGRRGDGHHYGGNGHGDGDGNGERHGEADGDGRHDGHRDSQACRQAHPGAGLDRRPLQTVLKAIFLAGLRYNRAMRPRRVACASVVASALLLASTSAHAGDPAAAREQVKLGYQLAQDGKCDEAIPHFVESLKLDAKAITLINLAACEEKTLKLADALGHWVEARGRAQTEGNSAIQEEAEKKAKALEARIPKLTVVLAGATPDAEVVRDGVALGAASMGVPLPVNPGAHSLVVRAKGHEDTTENVTIAEGESKRVELKLGVAKKECAAVAPLARRQGRAIGRNEPARVRRLRDGDRGRGGRVGLRDHDARQRQRREGRVPGWRVHERVGGGRRQERPDARDDLDDRLHRGRRRRGGRHLRPRVGQAEGEHTVAVSVGPMGGGLRGTF